ncbi:MAG: Anti-sigma factor antagonist [Ilumatobacteraceae bacterium]|nr:Anti-sigma factor antagonist [Ilumatobacteraceae bacterium]
MGQLEIHDMEEIGKNESIRVQLDPDGVVIAEGDIDLAGGPVLDAAIVRVEGSKPVVIDLAAVEFIDSSGLRSLLAASRRAETRHSSVVLRNPSSGVLRLLSITGTADQFTLEPADSAAE